MAPTKRKPKTTGRGRARTKAKAPARRKTKATAKPVTVERHLLHDLRPPAGSHRARIRKGRRPGSGIGKTAGRGGKGRAARPGGPTPPGRKSSRRAARSRADPVTAPQIPNLFKVPELKAKILFTLLCLLIYRLGAHIATPGVNVQALADFLKNAGQGTLFSLYDLFAGGGFSRATVFALGIMPYISASIVFQLAAPVFPVVEKMQRDEEGRKTLTQWTRYLTVLLCLFQSYGYALFAEQLPGAVAHPGWAFRLTTVLTLSTGGVFIMWLGEQITERGIGNGASLLIFFSIVERIWPETLRTLQALRARSLTVAVLLMVPGFMVLVVAGHAAAPDARSPRPGALGGKPQEAGGIHSGRETRRRHGRLHRRRVVADHAARCHLPHRRRHAAHRRLERPQHAVRVRRYGPVDRGGRGPRHGPAGAAAPPAAALRRIHAGRRGRQRHQPRAVPALTLCSSSSSARRDRARAPRARSWRSA